MTGRLSKAPAEGGFTLIEVIVVLAIIAILVVAMGASFEGWRGRYRVESELTKLHADFMLARARARERKRAYFVSMPAATPDKYLVYEDTNPSPNGDGVLQTTQDTLVINTTLLYNISTTSTLFTVATDGIVSPEADILLTHAGKGEAIEGADYDCIELVSTRTNKGKWDGSDCEGK